MDRGALPSGRQVTPELLRLALHIPPARAEAWAMPMRGAALMARLNTVARVSAFLGQIGHESGCLRWMSELWGPTEAQMRYEPPGALATRLGNIRRGDGSFYRGHGCIQTTGRHNHARVRDRLRERMGDKVPDFEACPQALAQPLWAALSAADYWLDRDCNTLADAGDMLGLTKRINGGTNGLADRLAITAQARAACILTGYAS